MLETIRDFDLNILNCGLEPYTKKQKEEFYFPEIEKESEFLYFTIRNAYLNQWQKNPTKFLYESDLERILMAKRFPELRHKIYTFLNMFGHINHGAFRKTINNNTENIHNSNSDSSSSSRNDDNNTKDNRTKDDLKKKRICIIGAGVSGLCIFSRLVKMGFERVTVLEGRERIGGRIHSIDIGDEFPHNGNGGGNGNGNISKESSIKDDNNDIENYVESTDKMKEERKRYLLDLGASIVNGLIGNPLGTLLRQQDLMDELHNINTNVGILLPSSNSLDQNFDANEKVVAKTVVKRNEKIEKSKKGGSFLSKEKDKRISEFWNNLLAEAKSFAEGEEYTNESLADLLIKALEKYEAETEHPSFDEEEASFLFWLSANLEYANCTALDNVSGKHWDQDDAFDFTGRHSYIRSSYLSLIEGLVEKEFGRSEGEGRVELGTVVEKVCYKENVVEVYSSRLGFKDGLKEKEKSCKEYDAVFVTVPLGVLKAGKIEFVPSLPKPKLAAIERLGAGVMNKVVLFFKEAFWSSLGPLKGEDGFALLKPLCFIGCGDEKEKKTNSYFDLIKSELKEDNLERGMLHIFWNFHSVLDKPVLVSLCSGSSALAVEKLSEDELGELAFQYLSGVFPNALRPKKVVRTKWAEDPFSLMSYSFVGRTATGEDYDEMKKTVDNKVFFAGEACCRKHPATVAGGYISGLGAVSRFLLEYDEEALKTLKGKVSVEVGSKFGSGVKGEKGQFESFETNRESYLSVKEGFFKKVGVFGRTAAQSLKKQNEMITNLKAEEILRNIWEGSEGESLLGKRENEFVGGVKDSEESGNVLYVPLFKVDRDRRGRERERSKIKGGEGVDLKKFIQRKQKEERNKRNFGTILKVVLKLLGSKVKHKEVVKKVAMKVSKKYYEKFLKDGREFMKKHNKELGVEKFLNEKCKRIIKKYTYKVLEKYRKKKN